MASFGLITREKVEKDIVLSGNITSPSGKALISLTWVVLCKSFNSASVNTVNLFRIINLG